MGLLDFLTGNKNDKIKDFQTRGAVIIDVRTKGEFKQGAYRVLKTFRCRKYIQKLII